MTSRYRHLRTQLPTTPFPAPLEPGEIAVNTANRQIAVGDAASASLGNPKPLIGVRFFDISAQYALNDVVAQGGHIYRANGTIPPGVFNVANWTEIGGTASGGIPDAPSDGTTYGRKDAGWTPVGSGGGASPSDAAPLVDSTAAPGTSALYSRGDHVHPSDASKANKTYVDSQDTAIAATVTPKADKTYVDSQNALKVNKAGDTMTGPLVLPADPTTALQVTTKQYVDAGDAALQANINAKPSTAYVDAGDATNAASISAKADKTYVDTQDALSVLKAGSTMTGLLVLSADPGAALGAATKQYVDGKVVVPAAAAPIMDGAAAVGVAAKYAREDHVHPTDTSRAAASAIPAAATAAEYLANSAPTKMLTPGAVWTAAGWLGLTDAATVTPDFSLGIDFIWTLGAAGRTLANPANPKAGQKGVIYLIQDGTGNRTITTWGSSYKFSGGTKPTLSTAAGSIDILSYVVSGSLNLFCTLNANFY